jgi:hypothetical protein
MRVRNLVQPFALPARRSLGEVVSTVEGFCKTVAFLFFVLFNFNLVATTHTNRNFMMPRPVSENMVLRYASWYNQINAARDTNRGATFQITPFYQHSTDRRDQGKYFGYYAQGEGEIRDYIDVVNVDDFGDVGDATWAAYIVHLRDNYGDNLAGKMRFRPDQEIYGVHFDYHQNMHQLLKGLFLEISLPVVNIRNDLDLSAISQLTPIDLADHPSRGKTLQDYFRGEVYNMQNDAYQQKPLEYAKIDISKSRTDFADLTTKLGYRIFDKKSWCLSLNGYCLIPTGNKSNPEYLFDPVCGNGNHWFFGFGPDVRVNIWNGSNSFSKNSFDLFSSLKISYGLEATQKRTLGIKKDDGTPVPFSQYYLVGQRGVRHLFPFANISTLDLQVTPKWQFEGLVNLDFMFSDFHVAVGYNLFLKEKEAVFLKSSWSNDSYAIAYFDYRTNAGEIFLEDNAGNIEWDAADVNILGDQHYIEEKNLDISAVSTPCQTTHKIYAVLGYQTTWKNPLMFSFGGAYEFSDSNSAFDNYSFWGNVSLAF